LVIFYRIVYGTDSAISFTLHSQLIVAMFITRIKGFH
jgi:hypothetical protein